MSQRRKAKKAAAAPRAANSRKRRASKSTEQPAATTTIARRRTPAAVAVRAGKVKLTKDQRTILQDKLGDDEFLLDKAIIIAEASAEAANTMVMTRYQFGVVFREIKARRKDKGVERVAEVLGWAVSTVYDCMLLAERIPHDTVGKLVASGADWTMLKTIAHGETAAVRNKFVNRLLAGERLTYREVTAELQQAAGGRRSGGGRPVTVPRSVKSCLAKLLSTVNNTAKVVPKVSQAIGPMLEALPTARITASVREQLDAVVSATDAAINDLQAERNLMTSYLERFAAGDDDEEDTDDVLANDDESDTAPRLTTSLTTTSSTRTVPTPTSVTMTTTMMLQIPWTRMTPNRCLTSMTKMPSTMTMTMTRLRGHVTRRFAAVSRG